MNKEMIIDASDEGVEIALLEDKKLVELHREGSDNAFMVGDLYLGKVKRLMPGLNAAFVDVGYEKDAFLHYTDLSPYVRSLLKYTKQAMKRKPSTPNADFGKFKNEPEIVKTGKITDVLNHKPEILVQILKEPISSKGPRLSCELSLPGRFVIITPFNNFVSISRKIHSREERNRLHQIVESIKPKNFGIIVRTAAEGKNTAEIHADLINLENRWNAIAENLAGAKAPKRILREQTKTTSILRDLLNDSFQSIVINEKGAMRATKEYVARIAPDKEKIVTYYNNGQPIFDHFGITRQVKASFGKTVNLKSGAYLIIEPTEALHVIDVNSGTRAPDSSQEESAFQANLEAATEIARQLRLRDLGGIIVVDFIDMKLAAHRKELYEHFSKMLADDRARHTVLPLSRFGLMQITRQRLRPEIKIATAETCPTCNGTGKVQPTILLTDNIENDLATLLSQGHRKLKLITHPMMAAYVRQGGFGSSLRWKWQKKYKVWLNVETDNSFPLTHYQFINKKTMEPIKLN